MHVLCGCKRHEYQIHWVVKPKKMYDKSMVWFKEGKSATFARLPEVDDWEAGALLLLFKGEYEVYAR